MSEQLISAVQLIRSIGYTARPGNGYVVVEQQSEDGIQIHIVTLDMVQAWVRSH